MQRYTQPTEPNHPAYTPAKYQEEHAKENDPDDAPSKSNYFVQLCVFILAMGINIGMWAIDYYSVGTQASYYYSNSFKVSSYTDATAIAYTDSTTMFNNFSNGPNSAVGVAMSLIYSWVLWKFALIAFTYHTISK